MRHSIIRGAIVTVMLLAFAQPALAQTLKGPVSDKPLTENWAPSKWGANDRAGSANYTNDPANVAKALATVKQNKVLTIGKYYHREAPAFGPRGWQLVIPGTPTGGPFRQQRAHLPRRARDRRARPDWHAVRRTRTYRGEHLERADHVQRRERLGRV